MPRFSVFIDDPKIRYPYVAVARVEAEAVDELAARSAALAIYRDLTGTLLTDEDVALTAQIAEGVDESTDCGRPIEGAHDRQPHKSIDPELVDALAHPLRVQILESLQGRIRSPSQFSDEEGEVDLSTISYHFRRLRKLGTIEEVATRRRRGTLETFYTARPRSFIGHQDWRRVPLPVRAGVTAEAVRTFVDKIATAIDADTIDTREDTTLNWMPITVDEEGWRAVAEILDRVLRELMAIAAASRERLGDADGIPVVTGLAAFEVPIGMNRQAKAGPLETSN